MRHPQLLRRDDCHVIAIDLQTKLLPAMPDAKDVLRRAGSFVAAARMMEIPITVTQHYTRGLGPTHSEILGVAGDCAPIEKIAFSCCGCAEFAARVEQVGRVQVVLLGLEAHICVSQTALDLLHRGYQPHVLADAVASRRDIDRDAALDRLRRAGAIVTTTEAAAYELLEVAGTELFKDALTLFK